VTRAQAHARRGDPETSHDAAAALTPERLRESQREVLWLLDVWGPMPDSKIAEAAALYGVAQSPSGLRTRRAELVAQGRVEWAGTWETIPPHRRARVWRVRELGALAVPCPFCHAPKAARCRTPDGHGRGPHAIRARYAARGWEQLDLFTEGEP
jgi:hypothetical protein